MNGNHRPGRNGGPCAIDTLRGLRGGADNIPIAGQQPSCPLSFWERAGCGSTVRTSGTTPCQIPTRPVAVPSAFAIDRLRVPGTVVDLDFCMVLLHMADADRLRIHKRSYRSFPTVDRASADLIECEGFRRHEIVICITKRPEQVRRQTQQSVGARTPKRREIHPSGGLSRPRTHSTTTSRSS